MNENLLNTLENRMHEIETKIILQKQKTNVELMMLDLIDIKLNKINRCKKQIQKTKKIGG